MVKIIVGEKGKGKTKVLLEKVNAQVKVANGNVVFLDKSNEHIYELDRKVRLINVKDFLIENYNEFGGFLCGVLSQDHDVETVYLDSFMKVACITQEQIALVLDKIAKISERFNIEFIVSLGIKPEEVPEDYKENIILAL